MFKPLNRHVVIEKAPGSVEEEKSTILVPADYRVNLEAWGLYKVVSVSQDCEKVNEFSVGSLAVVDNKMVEELNIKDQNFCLVLENYILGFWEEE